LIIPSKTARLRKPKFLTDYCVLTMHYTLTSFNSLNQNSFVGQDDEKSSL
jgi:hypothetical protein